MQPLSPIHSSQEWVEDSSRAELVQVFSWISVACVFSLLCFSCIKGCKVVVILELSRAIFSIWENIPEIKVHPTDPRDRVGEAYCPDQSRIYPLKSLTTGANEVLYAKGSLSCTGNATNPQCYLASSSCHLHWSLICTLPSRKRPDFFLLCLCLTIWCH